MGLTITNVEHSVFGNKAIAFFDVAFDSSYLTGGESLDPSIVGMYAVDYVNAAAKDGYLFDYDYTNKKLKAFYPAPAEESHTHAVALDSGASAAGSAHQHAAEGTGATGAGDSHNHAFTGTSIGSLNLASPAFSGTGLTASGQDITTTDNQTMTLNECAGMWLMAATVTAAPLLIVSNTAVTTAPAVLTVKGAAATDAGDYKIVKNIIPTGSNAAEATHTHTGPSHQHATENAHTHASGTLADAASGAAVGTANVGTEVGSTDDLSSLSGVKIIMIGN